MSAPNPTTFNQFSKRTLHEAILRGNPLSECLLANDILYLIGYGNYSWLVTTKGQRYLCSRAISFYDEYLVNNSRHFIRTHKSCIINLRGVHKHNSSEVIMIDGYHAPISRRRRATVISSLKI